MHIGLKPHNNLLDQGSKDIVGKHFPNKIIQVQFRTHHFLLNLNQVDRVYSNQKQETARLQLLLQYDSFQPLL